MILNIHKKLYSCRYDDVAFLLLVMILVLIIDVGLGVGDGDNAGGVCDGDSAGDSASDGGKASRELGMKGLHPSATPAQDIHHKNKWNTFM